MKCFKCIFDKYVNQKSKEYKKALEIVIKRDACHKKYLELDRSNQEAKELKGWVDSLNWVLGDKL